MYAKKHTVDPLAYANMAYDEITRPYKIPRKIFLDFRKSFQSLLPREIRIIAQAVDMDPDFVQNLLSGKEVSDDPNVYQMLADYAMKYYLQTKSPVSINHARSTESTYRDYMGYGRNTEEYSFFYLLPTVDGAYRIGLTVEDVPKNAIFSLRIPMESQSKIMEESTMFLESSQFRGGVKGTSISSKTTKFTIPQYYLTKFEIFGLLTTIGQSAIRALLMNKGTS